MLTGVYLSNRAPHAEFANAMPYNTLYGKDYQLVHLRAIWARAFVHVEAHTKKLDLRAWERRHVGYIVDSKSFRVNNPATRSVH